MDVQLARRLRVSIHYGIKYKSRATGLIVAACGLCVSSLCDAQGVGPTPQPQPAPVAPDQATQVAPETWAIHGQSTITWLLQPRFASRFQGPQSLSSATNGRETYDATLYLGYRPWRGAEIWFDPEIDQGFGLADTFGAAGYPSGESYKLGNKDPYFIIQRLFYRQTIDLGGESEQVTPDLNQLSGIQTHDRLVITAGKFSVVDIFDANTYAHDPRHDFFNWTLDDQGSFDYSANAWGFTYGAAAEWYRGRWAARVGLFDLSNTPNGVNLDGHFISQIQYVAGLEERHRLWDQPGKLNVLYWLDRGELGAYDQAVAFGVSANQTPSTGAVRNYRSKDGVLLDLEQQIAPDLGMFLRAGASQGSVEEDAFTDVNQSVSAGLSQAGMRWRRPDDNVGAAVVINRISRAGKQYLAAGGLGGITGDGRLPNAGPEQILETYYSLSLLRVANLTADYQLINHPAYNRDRGPVSVFGLRLHGQF